MEFGKEGLKFPRPIAVGEALSEFVSGIYSHCAEEFSCSEDELMEMLTCRLLPVVVVEARDALKGQIIAQANEWKI